MIAVLALLRKVPIWAWLALAALLAISVQTYRFESVKADYADYRSQIYAEKQIAEEAARKEEQRRQASIEKVRNDAQAQKALDDARAAELAATGDGLRKQVNGLLSDRAALRARLAAGGKTIDDLVDLLAQLRTEADSSAGELATALDASRRSGFACERSYDAIANKQ